MNLLPPDLKMECATITELTSSTPMDLDATGEIFHVTRENADDGYHVGCRKVNPIYAVYPSNKLLYLEKWKRNWME